jgi:Mrp family chromosome partitioning ATPase
MSKNIEVLLRAKEATELLGSKTISHENSEVWRSPVCVDRTKHAEAAELVQRVFLLSAHEAPRVVVFCGVGHVDGGSLICARAAENLANQIGSSVCVVEGDFHSPSLHQYLGVDNTRGLADALLESGPIQDFIRPLPKGNLFVLPGGSRSREIQGLWKSDRLQFRIAELRREFSYVLVYGPEMNQYVDGMLLGRIADGVILILESMVTRRESARTAAEQLAAANVKILGAVLNNHPLSIPETLYRKL